MAIVWEIAVNAGVITNASIAPMDTATANAGNNIVIKDAAIAIADAADIVMISGNVFVSVLNASNAIIVA